MASCPPCVRSNKDKHLRNLHIACIAADTLLAQLPALSKSHPDWRFLLYYHARQTGATGNRHILFSTLLVAVLGQFNQGGFFTSPQRRQTQPGRRNVFLSFDDDDFDDFFDDDDDDSLEDLYEDLYDDDAHDRAQARAALTRLRASGAITGNSFRNNRFIPNRGFGNNNGFRTSGFNSNGFRTSRFNNNGFSNRFPSNSRSTGFNSNNRFGTNNRVSSFNNNNRFASNPDRASSFNSNLANRFPTNTNSHFRGPNTANSGFGRPLSSSNPFTTKRSSGSSFSSSESLNAIPGSSDFKSASTSSSPFKSFNSNINRLGGNGYFFSMKTHGAEPVTYFIRYDD
nr:homeobox protein 5-like [Penaeus vannamei]